MKRSQDIRWAEVRVGLFLVVALTLAAGAIFLLGERSRLFVPTVTVEVLLPEVQGLQVGAPVWLSGVVIGSVEAVAFASPLRSDEVRVTLRLEKDAAQRLGSAAQVTVKTQGLLGAKYVDITPGGQAGLPPGPLQGEPPMGLEDVISRAYGAFDKLGSVADQLTSQQGSLARLIDDPTLYDNLAALAGRLDRLTETITEGEGSLALLINDPTLYRKLLAFGTQGEKAVKRLDALAARLQNPEGTLGRLAADPTLYREGVATLVRARDSMARLDAFLDQVAAGDGTTGALIQSRELHDRLNRTLADLDVLMRDLRENPGRYVNFSLF